MISFNAVLLKKKTILTSKCLRIVLSGLYPVLSAVSERQILISHFKQHYRHQLTKQKIKIMIIIFYIRVIDQSEPTFISMPIK